MTENSKTRLPRAAESRDATAARKSWKRPELLPTPEPRDGIVFRYIRTSMVGTSDNTNVSAKFREGWRPVLASDYPELMVVTDHNSRFPENIEIGGLLLCSNAAETMAERRAHQQNMADAQMRAVDESYMRQSDARMPVLMPERSTRTEFGGK